jgi:hypothetical protein
MKKELALLKTHNFQSKMVKDRLLHFLASRIATEINVSPDPPIAFQLPVLTDESNFCKNV